MKNLLPILFLFISSVSYAQVLGLDVNPVTQELDIVGYDILWNTTTFTADVSTDTNFKGRLLMNGVAVSTPVPEARILSLEISSKTLAGIATGLGVSTQTLAGVDTGLGISTRTLETDVSGLKLSTMTLQAQDVLIGQSTGQAEADITALETLYYTTGSIYACFIDTAPTGIIESTVVVRVPFDCIIKEWHCKSDVSGSVTVRVASSSFADTSFFFMDGTDNIKLNTQSISSSTALTGWQTSIPRGTYIKFMPTAATTVQQVYPSIEIWKPSK